MYSLGVCVWGGGGGGGVIITAVFCVENRFVAEFGAYFLYYTSSRIRGYAYPSELARRATAWKRDVLQRWVFIACLSRQTLWIMRAGITEAGMCSGCDMTTGACFARESELLVFVRWHKRRLTMQQRGCAPRRNDVVVDVSM